MRVNYLTLAVFGPVLIIVGVAGFGLIDLYQALASYFHLLPEKYFLWTRADDILHILIGATLVIIGCYAILKRERRTS